MSDKYCLAQDNTSHWYVIPVAKRDDWSAWLELDEDNEAAWEAPEWAMRTYGAPGLVEFENPLINIE